MPARTLSSDSMTLHSMTQFDAMDPEIRLQIQSNIHVLYDPSTAPQIHIATCRGTDGAYLAFLVKQDNVAKAMSNPSPLASVPQPSRSAAMISLLEATEQRVAEILINSKGCLRSSGGGSKKSSSSAASTNGSTEPKIIRMPTADGVSAPVEGYGERGGNTAERDHGVGGRENLKGLMSWSRKHTKVEQQPQRHQGSYVRNVVD